MEPQTQIVTLAFEAKDLAKLESVCQDFGIQFYRIDNFFDIEKFTTLEEVKKWWEIL